MGNSTVLMSPEQLNLGAVASPAAEPAAADDAASQKPTDRHVMLGPREDSPANDSVRGPHPPGGPFGLGWPLVAALGAGALIVISMLIWVITLARRGH